MRRMIGVAAIVLLPVSALGAGPPPAVNSAAPIAAVQIAADPWKPMHLWGGSISSPSARARMRRHWTYMHSGVPPSYRGKTSPLTQTADVIDRGRLLYTEHCAACHRMDGMGGGRAAMGLSPSPALLGHLIQRPGAADEYLLWTVSEGGSVFDTDMPGFADRLDRKDIWRIIAYMRAGFPAPGAPPAR